MITPSFEYQHFSVNLLNEYRENELNLQNFVYNPDDLQELKSILHLYCYDFISQYDSRSENDFDAAISFIGERIESLNTSTMKFKNIVINEEEEEFSQVISIIICCALSTQICRLKLALLDYLSYLQHFYPKHFLFPDVVTPFIQQMITIFDRNPSQYTLWNSAFLLISNIILPSNDFANLLKPLISYPFSFISNPNIDLSRIFSCAHGFAKHLGYLIPCQKYQETISSVLMQFNTFKPINVIKNDDTNVEEKDQNFPQNPIELFLSALWLISDAFECTPQVVLPLFSGTLQLHSMLSICLKFNNEDFLVPIFKILTKYLQIPPKKEKSIVDVFNLLVENSNFGGRCDFVSILSNSENPRIDLKIEVLKFIEAFLNAYSQLPPDDYSPEEESENESDDESSFLFPKQKKTHYRQIKWSDQAKFFQSLIPSLENSEFIIFQLLIDNLNLPYDLLLSSLKTILSYVSYIIPQFFQQISFPQLEIFVKKALEIIDQDNEIILNLFLDSFIAMGDRNRFDAIDYFIDQKGLNLVHEYWSDNPSVGERVQKIMNLRHINTSIPKN